MSGDIVIVEDDVTQIIETAGSIVIIEMPGGQGPQGMQGIPGPAGGSTFQRPAGQDLSGHRAVYSSAGTVLYASASNPLHVAAYLGITNGAAMNGATVDIVRTGGMSDPSFSFVPGPIYLGELGVLTQTEPLTGMVFPVGFAESATVIFLNPQAPIVLA